MNPYGYLPGHLFPFLPFYGALAAAYLLVCLVWLALTAVYNKDQITLQRFITVILVSCVAEALLCFADHYRYNAAGAPATPLLVLCAIIKCAHQTGSRVLVVAVSVGFGVVRPTLGAARRKLALTSAPYFALSVARELVTRLDPSAAAAPLLALDVALYCLDCLFAWWTMVSLYDTIAYLRAHKQAAKLWLMGRFALVLSCAVAAQVVFMLYNLTASLTPGERWEQQWLATSGFSQILYFVVVVTIAVLWRPSKTARRYEYSQVTDGGVILASGDDDDADDVELDNIAGDASAAARRARAAAAAAPASAGGAAAAAAGAAAVPTAGGGRVLATVDAHAGDEIDVSAPPQFTVEGVDDSELDDVSVTEM